MGAKDSKRACLSYEDAVKRISDVELKRICETFKRLSGGGQLMAQASFSQHVLGEGVPLPVAGWLYAACGGSARGIALRDLVCGLVLLTKGTQDEKLRFLWSLYCNDSGTHICKSDFQRALQLECGAPLGHGASSSQSLFPLNQDRASYEDFRAWISHNNSATVLSRWLLTEPSVSLATEVLTATPTFYQTLAGVTHLEERDISELEKSFWLLQAGSSTGQLDAQCLGALVSPPIPVAAVQGLFHALDVNRDGHVDFKELCCGVSAACRGPIAERVKFCFKMFDLDTDGKLNQPELSHMLDTLTFIQHRCQDAEARPPSPPVPPLAAPASLEDLLIWSTRTALMQPTLELLFQVCHVSLGLRPRCRHQERDIALGWLAREESRGYKVGQFWYLVSSEWWKHWLAYTSWYSPNSSCAGCNVRLCVEEGIQCDESLTSNSTESMTDLLRAGAAAGGADSCSLASASSSGVSSSSGSGGCGRRGPPKPGPIDNLSLVADTQYKVQTLTGEGGRLKRDRPLVQHRDFELIPDSLWKALSQWYGGSLPLPRQVIQPPDSNEVDLELYPLNLRILRHQQPPATSSALSSANPNGGASGGTPSVMSTWGGVVGGYGSTALSPSSLALAHPRRYLAYTAAFSRLATVQQVLDFLSHRLGLRYDDLRLWHIPDAGGPLLLDSEACSLQALHVRDGEQLLLEVRSEDLTWPEELGALAAPGALPPASRGLPAGATGLHNLGNTCFMNAALQAVSNTRPLTMYFRKDGLSELNQTNPLGTRGQVARRYTDLLHQLWTGSARSIAPLKLRWCVARHAPHLGGGGQHDSQELLAWLLDALHEDLNRVASKRYTELSDSAGRPDKVVALEAWTHHLDRDHSVITDLFYGQLKSKVTCQTCGHESVRFDAFNVLSLPLPMDSYTLCEVLVLRLDGSVPVRYGLRVQSDARYADLKPRLQALCGVAASRLALAEVADARVRLIHVSKRVGGNGGNTVELMAYEVQECVDDVVCVDGGTATPPGSPREVARSPEVSSASALCMPSILCFKNPPLRRSIDQPLSAMSLHRLSTSPPRRASLGPPPGSPRARYVAALHRKCVRQDAYFVTQHRTRPVLFGVPLLLAVGPLATAQMLYQAVWTQVTRLLSPLPQGELVNHAMDCDDSLGYEFPFTLRTVTPSGHTCSTCPWTKFCRGCTLPCDDTPLPCSSPSTAVCPGPQLTVAIDWDPTALHLRYQSSRERAYLEDPSVQACRRQHTEPVDLDHCLRAFTSEESLETWYHCSSCENKQPATKKLQIWRLPPILIIHLKRFDYVNNKWVKTHKVVNFPFNDFDPTAYLASVPQETILRHRALRQRGQITSSGPEGEVAAERPQARRDRLESTSLTRTPVLDEALEDFHMHHLQDGQDAFDLKYQLYAVVSHSGLLNGGHYISYACNPNGSWYCYNDSSCREVSPPRADAGALPPMDTSSAYMLFYERAGLAYAPYMPEVPPGGPALLDDAPDEDDSELRKQCSLQ